MPVLCKHLFTTPLFLFFHVYLHHIFSCILIIRYKHFGQFAPLGGEQTAAQLPGDWVSIGHSSQWLWYSVYAR